MARVLQPQHSFDPCNDFVTGGSGGLVQIDQSKANVLVYGSLQRRTTVRRVRLLFDLDQHLPLGFPRGELGQSLSPSSSWSRLLKNPEW